MIGSHTVTHGRLDKIPISEVKRELVDSKAMLERLVDYDIFFLALPHGAYSKDVLDIAFDAGYRKVLTLDETCISSRSESGKLGRFTVSPDMWWIEFRLTVIGAYSWLLPWRRLLYKIRSFFGFLKE